MGIPKFFRWLSERYPLISVPIEPGFLPDFDCLYLDMNGIIHNCSHPEWNDNLMNRLSEKEMYLAIFRYIDRLFQTIKPKKVFYMAVDGVAPRAKMNQQRQRRFRSAQEAQEEMEKALEKGMKPPTPPFDSNAITPGTKFMAKLSEVLKYFIQRKIKEDSSWRGVKIIFSGHEVPGEGEHKIMEYIRIQKEKSDYDPNTRHCLYGLDADLIMLALASHDPHFALLREEVIFGRRNKKNKHPDAPVNFQLLYINILREYFDREFAMDLPFGYDLECIIDDFIMMCFFVGNDFLPELPYLDIADSALDKMFDIYRDLLPTLPGYLTHSGEPYWDRLEVFLGRLSKYEQDMLATMPPLHLDVLERQVLEGSEGSDSEETSDTDSDEDQVEGEEEGTDGIQNVVDALEELEIAESHFDEEVEEEQICFGGAFTAAQNTETENQQEGGKTEEPRGEIQSVEMVEEQKEEDGTKEQEEAHEDGYVDYDYDDYEDDEDDGNWRNWYYREKFLEGLENEEFHYTLRKSFLEGLLWNLRYYYNGCASWSWFYPYHYAPLVTDLTNLSSYKLEFDLSTPFRPFEQLMGVLPPASKELLPVPYAELFEHPDLVKYYPDEFKVDMNGKRNPWEGIALIEFVDQELMLSIISQIDQSRLTEDEKRRNSFGEAYIYEYNINEEDTYPSPIPKYFYDLSPSLCSCTVYDYPVLGQQRAPTLPEGVRMGADGPPGFPTLDTLKHTASLYYAGLSIFGNNSRKQSLVLNLLEPNKMRPEFREKKQKELQEDKKGKEVEDSEKPDMPDSESSGSEEDIEVSVEALESTLLGSVCFVNWPHLREAMVLGISDKKCRASQFQGIVVHTKDDAAAWQKETNYQKNMWKSKKGIQIGEVKVMLHVKLMTGIYRRRDGSRVKKYSNSTEVIPYQVTLKYHHSPDPKLQECEAPALQDRFPVGSTVVYLGGGKGHGGIATVLDHLPKDKEMKEKVLVEVTVPNYLPPFHISPALQDKYYSFAEMSRRLSISPKVLSKVTASVYTQFQNRKINIGLRLKFTRKGQQVLGYTQKVQTQPPNEGESFGRGYWLLSQKSYDLVELFKKKFPELFESMERDDAQEVEVFMPEELFPNGDHAEKIREVDQWLRSLESNNLPRVPVGSKTVSSAAMKAIEKQSNRYAASQAKQKVQKVKLEVSPKTLLNPISEDTQVENDTTFGNSIPRLGERVLNLRDCGPIPFGLTGTVVSNIDDKLEVLFDKEFIGGNNLNGRCSELRGLTHISPVTLLNLSKVVPHSGIGKKRNWRSKSNGGQYQKNNGNHSPNNRQYREPRSSPNTNRSSKEKHSKNTEEKTQHKRNNNRGKKQESSQAGDLAEYWNNLQQQVNQNSQQKGKRKHNKPRGNVQPNFDIQGTTQNPPLLFFPPPMAPNGRGQQMYFGSYPPNFPPFAHPQTPPPFPLMQQMPPPNLNWQQRGLMGFDPSFPPQQPIINNDNNPVPKKQHQGARRNSRGRKYNENQQWKRRNNNSNKKNQNKEKQDQEKNDNTTNNNRKNRFKSRNKKENPKDQMTWQQKQMFGNN
eukprot:CAMPEP_0174266432 /NCGR_PEP_ID=MMETSP0439-20130205/30202_1 /TAXON_ID=0 /ORGANISM="Stereomyxa ramosa, Strain Chinc5" /LENGTH=1547 /DNA_ID=CAMNT_0015353391 /DNA_START=52 /DNA_END=4695 /DNA_ORIENTATION=-